MSTAKKTMLSGPIVKQAILQSVYKLNPVTMMKNPVMFIVEVGTIVVLLMTLLPGNKKRSPR